MSSSPTPSFRAQRGISSFKVVTTMTCERIQPELKAYADNEVGALARWRVGRHLRRCANCASELAALRRFTDALRSVDEVAPRAGFRAALFDRLPDAVAPSATQPPSHSATQRRRSPMFRIATVAVPLAVVSALLVSVKGNKARNTFVQVNTRMTAGDSLEQNKAMKKRSGDDGDLSGKYSTTIIPPTVTGIDSGVSDSSVAGQAGPPSSTKGVRSESGVQISGNLMKRTGGRETGFSDDHYGYTQPNQNLSKEINKDPGVRRQMGAIIHDPSLRIIRNADVTLKVKNFQTQWDTVGQIARSVGGFIAESNVDKDEDSLTGSITVRVPEKFFESALERISKLGTLEGKKVSSQDVSQEYTDTQSRMRNLKSQEARLLVLMDHAKRLQDILRIETELNRVRDEIEKATGRLKFLGSQTTYSTINVAMHEKAKKKPVPVTGGWTFNKEVKNAYAALKDALKVAATVAIWTVIYVPFYLVLVAVGFAAYRKAGRVWKPA